MIFQFWTLIVYIFLPKLSFFRLFLQKKRALVGSDFLGQGRTWGGQMTSGEDREDNFDQGRTSSPGEDTCAPWWGLLAADSDGLARINYSNYI